MQTAKLKELVKSDLWVALAELLLDKQEAALGQCLDRAGEPAALEYRGRVRLAEELLNLPDYLAKLEEELEAPEDLSSEPLDDGM